MRIVENNNTIVVECSHCKSKLAVAITDIRYVEMAHHGSPFYITCLACGVIVEIASNQIPPDWRRSLAGDD